MVIFFLKFSEFSLFYRFETLTKIYFGLDSFCSFLFRVLWSFRACMFNYFSVLELSPAITSMSNFQCLSSIPPLHVPPMWEHLFTYSQIRDSLGYQHPFFFIFLLSWNFVGFQKSSLQCLVPFWFFFSSLLLKLSTVFFFLIWLIVFFIFKIFPWIFFISLWCIEHLW